MGSAGQDERSSNGFSAYAITGPESGGNRLMASILIRSGCTGSASTDQPTNVYQIPDATSNYVFIYHRQLSPWIAQCKTRGYSRVIPIIMIRDPIAQCQSMVNRGHVKSIEEAEWYRFRDIYEALRTCHIHDIIPQIVTYEGLSERFLEKWLPMIGLPVRRGPISLPGQSARQSIDNQNAKYYTGG